MYFQVLDSKKECYGVYYDGDIYHYYNNLDMRCTWEYTSHFQGVNLEYARIWCEGKTLDQACPEHLKDEWSLIQARGHSFIRSFIESKVDLEDVCFYDLVPKKFLLDYCRLKNDITKYVFENYKKPKNYDFMQNLTKLAEKISKRHLNVDLEALNVADKKSRIIRSNLHRIRPFISYDPWGSVTGRLTTKQKSFPILTLNKEYRNILRPNNDWFIELDFNAAELRTLLALRDTPQPDGDIHSWIGTSVFDNQFDRDTVKKKTFAWLYNPKASNKRLEKAFNKEILLEKYYNNGIISTPFGREIEVDDSKALNYLIQSTSSDLFLRQLLLVDKKLEGRKSYIAYCIHDSLVLDFCDQDRDLFMGIIEEFSKTTLGKFKVNISAGKDFGNMKGLEF